MYAKSLSIVHAPTTIWRLVYAFYCSSLTSYGMNCFLIFHSLLAFFFQGLNLAWLWVIPIFNPLFAPSAILLSFLSYHSAIPAVVSFDPCLLSFFWACCLFFSQWLSMVFRLFIKLLASSCVPFLSSWASLAHFLILHTHGILLTLLGFLSPITLSFILGVYGLSINSLLFYFITSSLLWPILTFLHHITSMGLLFLSPGSFRPICFPQGAFMYFIGLWTIVPAIRA